MSLFNIKMPKLGESVEEATITRLFIKVGDLIKEDDLIMEIATDKVDSEIPSPVAGRVTKILFKEGDKVAVGSVVILVDTSGAEISETEVVSNEESFVATEVHSTVVDNKSEKKSSDRFYSPLVKSISQKEKISIEELEKIEGTGLAGRVRKEDLLNYIEIKRNNSHHTTIQPTVETPTKNTFISSSVGDEIIEMDRMRKLIAEHMVMSKQVSAHVTNVVEADVTNLVMWREKNKNDFEKKEGVKLTYTPVFIDIVVKALKEFPMINASVDGTKIILRKSINVGIAVALPSGNLIVPVVKNADKLNISGIATEVNRLAENARKSKLSPDEIQGGTFTITNFGSFKNLYGTPIINHPQPGMIKKRPVVLETPQGDVIAIRHMMYITLTYDHRVIDGMLGGNFLSRIVELLEGFKG